MTVTKKEEKGTQGVNASQNGKTTPQIDKDTKPASETTKAKTIAEQMEFFDGLATLVDVKRRFETHKAAIKGLKIPNEELAKFETEKRYGVRISLFDDGNTEYTINNPKLVKEVQGYLLEVLSARIAEYDLKILTYGSN